MPTLHDHLDALTAPFAADQIEIKPGALTKDRDRALALAYADMRVYQERLDQVVGVANWTVDYRITTAGVLCTLTILEVTKTDVGDYPLADDHGHADENHLTTAVAQAFKRACATFGIGRFLYHLPQTWADYDADRKRFRDPQGVVRSLYQHAGLTAFLAADAPQDTPVARQRPARPQAEATHAPRREAQPPQDTPTHGTPPASDAQLGLIARLIIAIHQQDPDATQVINQLGGAFGCPTLARMTSREHLRGTALTKSAASDLITQLKALGTAQATA
jgi:hypothetical protein